MAVAKTARFEREHWLALGLKMLAREGPEALTLERLTAAARKTRGSFYHHFADHDAFLAALAAHWRQTIVKTNIAAAEAARGERETLARRTAALDHALERNMRRLGASAPLIADEVARVDLMRIACLKALFQTELGLGAEDALARARIQHAYFVGAQMVFPDADDRFRLRLQKTLGATLWKK